jgi:hypothetical protein
MRQVKIGQKWAVQLEYDKIYTNEVLDVYIGRTKGWVRYRTYAPSGLIYDDVSSIKLFLIKSTKVEN